MTTTASDKRVLPEGISFCAPKLRPKDVTAPLRMRRYRQRQKAKPLKAGVTISTPEMCSLAARLADGRATAADLAMAEKLIMMLVDKLPPDSAIEVR